MNISFNNLCKWGDEFEKEQQENFKLFNENWEKAIKKIDEDKKKWEKEMYEFDKEIFCSGCKFYFKPSVICKHKSGKFYCHGCFRRLQQKLV